MVTSINREGTGKGFDIELVRGVAGSVPVPVIASGGAGQLAHVSEVILDGAADAVCVASMLHYHSVKRRDYSGGDFNDEGNIEFLRSGSYGPSMEYFSVAELKTHLTELGIDCRYQEAVQS
jgi:cyclase